MKTALVLLFAVILDQCFGETRKFHPLVGFGKLAQWTERKLNRSSAPIHGIITRLKGLLAMVLLVAPFVYLAYLPGHWGNFAILFDCIILYIAIGARSLEEHARVVAHEVTAGNLIKSRQAVSQIVSRDTADMQFVDALKAAVESVLENGSDAIYGALFWYLVLGAPGVVLYRLVNTLDAMWGYKNEQFLYFGWAAARLDDVLSFIPARLTALTYTLLGNVENGWYCWHVQGPTWYSPNAGPVMAAGAGALGLDLGGPARYHGALKERPKLGMGRAPMAEDIERSLQLVRRGVCLWIGVVGVVGLIANA